MARPLRIAVPGGVYHVMSRGNERRDIFRDDRDRREFLGAVRETSHRWNVSCHTYCLMGNHYHLVLETPDANISRAVRHLNGVYAQAFNRRHDRVGHLFQGRFASKLIDRDAYLLTVSRYIVLNPVRAGLVTEPHHWKWSSYRAHAGQIEPPGFLSLDWLLLQFGTRDRRQAHEAYREFVVGSEAKNPLAGSAPVLGDDRFVKSLGDVLAAAAQLRDISRRQRFAARPSLQQLFDGCSDRRTRNAQILRAHVDHGYTQAGIADHLGLHPMTISRVVRANVEM